MLSENAKDLLLRVKAHILEEPNRLKMTHWVLDKSEASGGRSCTGAYWGEPPLGGIQFPKCNTVGCIAGWAVLLTDGMNAASEADFLIVDRAKQLLGFGRYYDADALFSVDDWPDDLRRAYCVATTQRERAQIVAARIDRFIAEEQWEQ